MPEIQLTVLINPRISSRSKKLLEGWEGCLSIPDLRGMVPRNESLVCEALDRTGTSIRVEASGFFARVIQHEWDHLQGNVYLDRMTNLSSLTHLSEFARYWAIEKNEES
jgi:peptide deformylase